MEDVARAAGVSLVTVSRAVNHPDKLAPATLAQVRAAIDRLRYVPNLTAGSLASSKSRIAAAVIPTLASSIFSDTMDGLSQALASEGYQLLLGQTHFNAEEEAQLIEAFVGRRVDGMVLIRTSQSPAARTKLQQAGIPVVEAWDLSADPIDMLVGFSNKDAGEAAARFLAGKGYRQLAYIGSPEGRSSARLSGFRLGARGCGLPAVVAHALPAPGTLAEAAHALEALLLRCPSVRAVLCANDMLAAGVLFECQRRRLDVPGRIAVMGFADLEIASATEPALTTVHVPSYEIGRRSGELLLARIRGDQDLPARVDLGFRVVARASA
jgi:LacI family gluconate utilization system Gnt-I transcriptional repressor